MKSAWIVVGVLVMAAIAAPNGQQAPPQSPPVFRSSVNLVLVDVVVRDKNGAVVKGLKLEDFELLEDGMRQQIITFASEEIATNAAPVTTTSTLSAADRYRQPGTTDVGRRGGAPPAHAPV